MTRTPLRDRILASIEVDANGCWIWQKSCDRDGYAQMTNGSNRRAHRVSYAEFKGEPPAGLQIDHLCRVRNCVNPEHLEAVDSRTNLMRGNTQAAANAAKTECAQGHPFSAENTKITVAGRRKCRKCSNRWNAESKRRATGFAADHREAARVAT